MDQLAYRLSRSQLLAVFAALFLGVSALLGWLLARDLALPRGLVASRQVIKGTGPTTVTKQGSTSFKPGQAGGGTAGAAQASTAAVSGGQIKIGAVITQSGLGDETPIYHGLDAGIKAVNAEGGAHGITFNLEVLDDGSDPNRGQAALRRLVEQDHVFALVGECAPLTDIDASPYFDQQQIPVFGSCFASNQQYADPYMFPLVVKPYLSGQLMADYLIGEMGSNAPAVVSLDVNVLDQSYDGAVAGIDAKKGKPCDAEKVPITQASYDTVVLNERSNNCDGVILNLDPARTLSWMQSAQRYGYHPKIIGLTAFDQTVVDHAGSYSDGLVTYFAQYMPRVDPVPALQQFQQAMATYEPGERDLNDALVGYLAAVSFAQSIGHVQGPVSRQSFLNSLYSSPIQNGLMQPVQFRQGDHSVATACRFYVLHQGQWADQSNWYSGG
ncbi:MAG TPA: ABC transporter substrate-binding protein [Candidatus Dormibacteraeota bacterium]